ncbi:leucine-rich repeat domain-containing protein [Lacinutrix sp. MEBiC02404]
MKKSLLILMALFITIIGHSQTFTDANFIEYTVSGTNTVEVTGYDFANGGSDVAIPATVDNATTTYSVTAIGTTAFQNNDLTSVIIPDSVLTIGVGAFVQNYNLDNVIIGNNVTSIGDAAFRYAALTSITIPASVTYMGFAVFTENLSLTDVYSESATPPTIITGTNDTFGSSTINSLRSGIHLHIPAGTMGAYVTDAGALWTGFMSVTEDALSISDFELANEVKVVTTLDALKIISSGAARLENYTIYSITGAKVKEGTENTIAIDAMSSGVYILELNFDTGKLTKKFAK